MKLAGKEISIGRGERGELYIGRERLVYSEDIRIAEWSYEKCEEVTAGSIEVKLEEEKLESILRELDRQLELVIRKNILHKTMPPISEAAKHKITELSYEGERHDK